MEDTASFKPKSDISIWKIPRPLNLNLIIDMEDTASFKPKSDYRYGRYRVVFQMFDSHKYL